VSVEDLALTDEKNTIKIYSEDLNAQQEIADI